MGVIEKGTDLAVRAGGVCPHSRKKCDRARLCTLTAPEACLSRVLNRVPSCSRCRSRLRVPCPEAFECFRTDLGKRDHGVTGAFSEVGNRTAGNRRALQPAVPCGIIEFRHEKKRVRGQGAGGPAWQLPRNGGQVRGLPPHPAQPGPGGPGMQKVRSADVPQVPE